jgi:WD40 repeat protein
MATGRKRGGAIFPDGRLLATGQPLHTFGGHAGWIRALAFAPDGRTFVPGSEDSTVPCWDVTAALRAPP